jgi:hypothetical protein
MKRERRDVWVKRVERWRDSGLGAREFAAEVGINENTLRSWGWKLAAEQRRAEEQPPARKPAKAEATVPKVEPLAFVEVAAPAVPQSVPAEKLELVLASGLVVRLPARFEGEALRRLLAVVG